MGRSQKCVPPILGVPGLALVLPVTLCPCLSSGKLCLAHGSHHAGRVGVAEGETGGGVDGCWRGQDVSRVAEGWEMAHGCHVSSQGSRTEWGRLLLHALGQLLKALSPFLALLRLAGHLPVPGLDPFLLHSQWPVNLRAATQPLGQVPYLPMDPFSTGQGKLGHAYPQGARNCAFSAVLPRHSPHSS